ncbi:hypothetical protein [Streptomyces sp. NPDC002685]|uniref:DUF7847 domain-containing protein n=1 Tax=Streptomyces sp. NPDC002685 TaxID=3154540 RepID=UPI00332898F2
MSDSSGWGPSGPYGGAPGGWGWMPPPPPPKPGVIPLAPLGVDTVLGGAFVTMRRYARPLFGLAALVGLCLAALTLGMAGLAYAATADQLHRISAAPRTADWTDIRAVLVAFGTMWAVGLLVALVANAFIQASSAATLHDAVLGRRAHIGGVWRRAWPRTPSVFGVMLLMGLIVVIPLALFALMSVALVVSVTTSEPFVSVGAVFLLLLLSAPLTIWLYVLFSFAPAAAVLEGASPLTAMRRSVRLMRGTWWRTFGITLLGGLIAVIASLVIRLPLMFAMPTPQPYVPSAQPPPDAADVFAQLIPEMGPYLVLSLIVGVVTQMFSMVFMPLVTNLLYIDQRIRREGLADVLMRVAVIPESPGGPDAPGAPGAPGSVQ